MQYQVSGTRTLVSQRGTVRIEPGDFVEIPAAIAFTSISGEPTSYISVVTRQQLVRTAQIAKKAENMSPDAVCELQHS
jgi:hypothetical protein